MMRILLKNAWSRRRRTGSGACWQSAGRSRHSLSSVCASAQFAVATSSRPPERRGGGRHQYGGAERRSPTLSHFRAPRAADRLSFISPRFCPSVACRVPVNLSACRGGAAGGRRARRLGRFAPRTARSGPSRAGGSRIAATSRVPMNCLRIRGNPRLSDVVLAKRWCGGMCATHRTRQLSWAALSRSRALRRQPLPVTVKEPAQCGPYRAGEFRLVGVRARGPQTAR